MKNQKIIKICEEKFIYLNYSPRTRSNYLSHIRPFLESLGDKQIVHCNSSDFQSYLDNYNFTSISQQNQVINAIRFLYKEVLNKKYDKVSFKRPKSENSSRLSYNPNISTNHNIYITSDVGIENCWFINLTNNGIGYIKNNIGIQKNAKKILLTTDPKLIADGVQAIDDDFLQWFVKNPSCEEVETIITNEINVLVNHHQPYYKIIIPKEEHNQTDWEFEISSGYYGYRNKNTGDWIYESEYLKIFKRFNQETPTELKPVLSKLSHINNLGISQWYEVVYYADNRWCSYSGSKTFEDGEKVIEWKYCKDCF